jgi:hypothetical protein
MFLSQYISITSHYTLPREFFWFARTTALCHHTIIPPMLHTHSSIYHRRCIMFFSQYSSFPCQYHSTNAPYSFINLPPTLYNVFLPVLQFPLSIIQPLLHTHLHVNTTVITKTNGRSLGALRNRLHQIGPHRRGRTLRFSVILETVITSCNSITYVKSSILVHADARPDINTSRSAPLFVSSIFALNIYSISVLWYNLDTCWWHA